MHIHSISPRDTYPIRTAVLRPEGNCQFDLDEDESSMHYGVFIDGQLTSIASFFYEKNEKIPGEHQFRLRGMATLDQFKGQGHGTALLQTVIPRLKQNHCDTLWCNARTGAFDFYLKNGFSVEGEPFIIPDIGEHYLMYLDLTK